jgi:uncharacterized protein (UPF0332 family)
MNTAATDELLHKAQESLSAARILLEQGFFDFAVSRAYYAMFYAAEAVLLDRGLTFSKHTGVIAAFGEHFAKTEDLPRHLHRYLLDAFDLRLVGDYGAPGLVGEERAKRVIGWAEEFIDAVSASLRA